MNRDQEKFGQQGGQKPGEQQQQGNQPQRPGQDQQGGGSRNPGQQQQYDPNRPKNPDVNDMEDDNNSRNKPAK